MTPATQGVEEGGPGYLVSSGGLSEQFQIQRGSVVMCLTSKCEAYRESGERGKEREEGSKGEKGPEEVCALVICYSLLLVQAV